MKILFIGAGNMAQAIISRVVQKKIINENDIYIYEVNNETAKNVINQYKVKRQESINSNLSKYDVIILAVKPQVFLSFNNDIEMNKLSSIINKSQLIVSIMAGISIEKIKKFFINKNSIIRIMPNTPALIGESMSVISPSSNVSKNQLDSIIKMFNSIGKVEILEEKYIDAVTGLSGSGPAYVFTFIEALIQGGILCGLAKEVAEKLAIQTVLGSVLMINSSNSSIEELRHKVTSPGGTTIEGLSILEKNSFRSIVSEAVRAATKRSKQLSEKN